MKVIRLSFGCSYCMSADLERVVFEMRLICTDIKLKT